MSEQIKETQGNRESISSEELTLVLGGLLHDVGKVIYHESQKGAQKHSQNGYAYLSTVLENNKKLDDDEKTSILHSVAYHHANELMGACDSKAVSDNSVAYITYMADYVAAAVERMNDKNRYVDYDFDDRTKPLESVFNIINGNNKTMYYSAKKLGDGINNPVSTGAPIERCYYDTVVKATLDKMLVDMEPSLDYVNKLLAALEEVLTYVPAINFDKGDISLYDHAKMVAGLSSCIKQYVDEKNHNLISEGQTAKSYKEVFYDDKDSFIEEKAFLLYSMDISGIQKFIYTIHSEGALKNLRARSFYLEIMMEHIIDTFLAELKLTRANVIYSGGGHCYLIIPNTRWTREIINQFEKDTKQWLMENYGTALYVGSGYGEASANILNNIPDGSYSKLFTELSVGIEESKIRRYTASDILYLNGLRHKDRERECKVCKRTDRLADGDLCRVCYQIKELSQGIMDKKKGYFVVVQGTGAETHYMGLPLPGNCYLISESGEALSHRRENDSSFVRAYAKNDNVDMLNVSTTVKVGNYAIRDKHNAPYTFEQFANAHGGFKRIGILRADVDNLGTAFSQGFRPEHNTLSRTAALSRQLSLFFKYHLNDILKGRKAAVVYAGGDDLFIVGNWRDTISFSIDIQERFKKYTEGMLTMSAGIGIYEDSYPISRIADEVGDLESISKKLPNKNGVTLFPDDNTRIVEHDGNKINVSTGTYTWEDLSQKVMGEKHKLLDEFFTNVQDKGNSFLYKMLELIRNRHEKINFARYAYMLARLEKEMTSGRGQDRKQKEKLFSRFSQNMYRWMKDDEDSRQLITAIYLYVYENRGR